ncbi:carbonic anhydrase 14-like isoform X3 [Daphnia pulicaria]|uniref:carbonic anhydrase 14-like isoform X3 n=1 Tax=Daphnia pulicaria TaxID=35523 RepID=UPI001EEC20AD|nr:carbonic anhydrase 14-like isoform X3 [Daphnia pulicaria]
MLTDSKMWREHESFCGGEHQSPINIDSSKAGVTNYPKFCFHNYDLVFPERLEKNGHTVELKIEEQGLHAELPFITGGGLTDRYNFVQLHFHWGRQLFGSEHTIDRKEYAGELHIVHYNTKYGNFIDAIPQEDGLAALGILIKLTDRDNLAFRHLEQFENIIDPSPVNSDVLHFSVPLVALLPHDTDSFYRYNGSLTSGDCNEDVIWTVFDTPIAISERQYRKGNTKKKG